MPKHRNLEGHGARLTIAGRAAFAVLKDRIATRGFRSYGALVRTLVRSTRFGIKSSARSSTHWRNGMQPCLMTLVVVVLMVTRAFAQQQQRPPDNQGPSLEVTMGFIQEKLSAQISSPDWKVVADPATCVLTWRQHHDPSGSTVYWDSEITLPFREMAKIEVMPAQDYYDQANLDQPDNLSPNLFALRVLTTTQRSVHTQEKKSCKKGRCLMDAGKKVESRQTETFKGEWSTFLDEEMANRLAKAMLHAVELCGGGSKPEPF